MYVIGIDCGTGSLKGIVMDKNGNVIDSATQEYQTYYPMIGYCEQNPEDWYQACLKVLSELFSINKDYASLCQGISFSGQMHTMVLLDSQDEVLRPAILWNDVRTKKQTKKLNDETKEMLLHITKNQAVEGFTLPKLLWVQENEPEIFDAIRSVLLPKDYLRFRLSGLKHMDYSDAAGTLMLDLNTNSWSQELSTKLGYQLDWLPQLVESTASVGFLNQSTMDFLQLEKSIELFAGGADNACAAFAGGVGDDTTGLMSIGTSGVMLTFEKTSRDYGGRLHFFNGVNHYYAMGVTLAAGDSLKWLRNLLKVESSYDLLLEDIDTVPVGSEGLIFTPYLNGERTPHFDSTIRGSFIGLDAVHTQNHLIRSVLEGITFSLRETFEILKKTSHKQLHTLVSTGGGAKNPKWLQIQADIMNTPIRTLKVEEGPAMGAAMIAAVGAQWYPSMVDCIQSCVKYDKQYKPITENVEVYNDYFEAYSQIYATQKDISSTLIALRNNHR